MHLFLMGFAVVYGALAGWAVLTRSSDVAPQMVVVAEVAGAPVAAAWVTAEFFLWISPRRAFDRRVRQPIVLMVSGLAAGIASALLSTATLGLIDGYELLTLGGCASGCTLLAIGRLQRPCAG